MNFKKTLIAASISLMAGIVSAENIDFVIPVAGSGPAVNGGQWQSDVTIHNVGRQLLLLKLSYHDATGELRSIDLPLPGRTTKTLPDTVKNDFAQTESAGAIVIDTDDALRGKLSITSRTFNVTDSGELGQDIPALTATQSVAAGNTGVLNGPANATSSHFNFGVFASEDSTVVWRLVHRDGTIAKRMLRQYPASTQTAHNNGIESLFGEYVQDDDVVQAKVLKGRVWLYGSIVNDESGDPTYVPASQTRENLFTDFFGIDTDRDGKVDLSDADGDGVLDNPLSVVTGRFPNDFRIIVSDPAQSALTFTIIESDGTARLRDSAGSVTWWPGSILKGKPGKLVVRVSDGIDSVDFTIPANYR